MMILKNKLTKEITYKCLPVASALIALTGYSVMAQTPVSIIVSGTVGLNFGTFSAGAAGGTLTMSTIGARTSTGTVLPVAGAGLETPALLSISASTGASVVVSMDSPTYVVDDPGAGAPMNVTNFNINGGGATTTVSMTTNPIVIPMGARLNVGAAQSEGIYTGSYVVNANYL